MGSTGYGRFGTYDINDNETENMKSKSSEGGGNSNGEIECPHIIENIKLEDVPTSDYYSRNHSLPSKDVVIELHKIIYKGRLVVKTKEEGTIIGNLPTTYNYLKNCIEKGMDYYGEIVAVGDNPIPYILVNLNA